MHNLKLKFYFLLGFLIVAVFMLSFVTPANAYDVTCCVAQTMDGSTRGPYSGTYDVATGGTWNVPIPYDYNTEDPDEFVKTSESRNPYYYNNQAQVAAYGWVNTGWYVLDAAGGVNEKVDAGNPLASAWNDSPCTMIPFGVSPGSLYPNGCDDLPPDCTELAIASCGNLEFVVWDNVETCEYHCQQCDDKYQEAVANCGVDNFQFDDVACSYTCDDCINHFSQAETDCVPYGIDWFNFDTCQYACNDNCDGAYQNCYENCWALNGIYKFNCTETDIPGEEGSSICQCNDVAVAVDPPDESLPDPETEPDPDPVDPALESGWLEAIKGNTDKMIGQNDDQTGLLQDVANNTKKTVENQEALNDSLGSIANKLDNLKVDSSEIDLSTLEANTQATKDALTTTQAELDSFDSSFISAMDTAKDSAVSDMETSVTNAFNNVQSVDADNAGFFQSLFLSVVPPNSTCQPLDLSFRDYTLLVGCEKSDEVKQLLGYLVYVLTIVGIFALIHRELRPNS